MGTRIVIELRKSDLRANFEFRAHDPAALRIDPKMSLAEKQEWMASTQRSYKEG
jgi:hypothetical protein